MSKEKSLNPHKEIKIVRMSIFESKNSNKNTFRICNYSIIHQKCELEVN